MSFERKMKRNKLKQELKTNKIKEEYHNRYDTLEQRLLKEKKNERNGDKQQKLFQ